MFERITPEEAGVSSERIAQYLSMLRRRHSQMHSVLMMKGDKLFAEYYWAPFNKDFCHRMYSVTKSFTSVAIGLLEEEGKLSLDDKIIDHFPEKLDGEINEWLKKQTIRDMLTMTTAGHCDWWFGAGDPDRVHLYFNKRALNRPSATLWDYDSAGSQVMATLVEKLSGMSLFDYLNDKIFKHLGTFKTAEILHTPNGDSWGDSAMVCTSRDVMSFGKFCMNLGEWDGKRLMNAEYLKAATAKQVDNTESAHLEAFKYGYGYQFWRTEQNGFALVGMGHQFIICLPEKDIVFVCTADGQGNQSMLENIVNGFFDIVYSNIEDKPLPKNETAERILAEETRDLKLFAVEGLEDSPMRKELDGAVYECAENPMGWTKFSLRFNDATSGELHYTNAQGDKVLPFGVNHNVFGKFPQLGYSDEHGGTESTDGFMYDDAVSLAWRDDNKLIVDVKIIDKYLGTASFFFGFNGEYAAAHFTKAAEAFLGEYDGDLSAKVKK